MTLSIYIILWFLHKFSNICKPEEGWYGQPKYCYEKTIHVVLNQLCSSLWTSRSCFIYGVVIMSHLRPQGFFFMVPGDEVENESPELSCQDKVQKFSAGSRPWHEVGGGRSSKPLDKGRGRRSPKKLFLALRASVWSKNKGGGGPGHSPGSASAMIWLYVQSVTRNLACCLMSADETILNFSMCSLSFSSFPSTQIKTSKDESGPQSQLIKSYWNV